MRLAVESKLVLEFNPLDAFLITPALAVKELETVNVAIAKSKSNTEVDNVKLLDRLALASLTVMTCVVCVVLDVNAALNGLVTAVLTTSVNVALINASPTRAAVLGSSSKLLS
jgi:hypothetical protein